MSFASDARLEACRLLPTKRCCAWAELGAVLRVEGWTGAHDEDLVLSHPAVARKVYLLLKGVGVDARLKVERGRGRGRRSYRVILSDPARVERGAAPWARGDQLPGEVGASRCCRRAFLRGAFVCRGSLTEPEKTYHLEIAVEKEETARVLAACLESLGLRGRTSPRKGSFIVYLKESEEIAAFLNLIGAHQALLQLENVRIVKGMRNRVNRLVNCETANVDKTVKAAVVQLDAIRAIERRGGIQSLPGPLLALAEKRLENPYASLRELGELLSPKMSKSGASYRMQQILRIAEELGEEAELDGEKETPATE